MVIPAFPQDLAAGLVAAVALLVLQALAPALIKAALEAVAAALILTMAVLGAQTRERQAAVAQRGRVLFQPPPGAPALHFKAAAAEEALVILQELVKETRATVVPGELPAAVVEVALLSLTLTVPAVTAARVEAALFAFIAGKGQSDARSNH
jgi:hypothetical protein